MTLARNLVLAAKTAARHLSDDPVVLALQISRRLPAGLVQPAARGICRALPNSFAAVPLIAASVSGDAAGLDRRFAAALAADLSPDRARRAADVALAANRPETADRLLPLAAASAKLPATTARRRWYDGDLSGAVAALAHHPNARLRRQHDRLAGELRTLDGWRPTLPKNSMKPVPGRVLHLLTNSLPHTGSGYAQRSHSILCAQQDAGWEVLAVTRLGYPVQVGKVAAQGQDVVDGVRYRRLIPSGLSATADARLQQEAEMLLDVALEFRPEVLHTTTHFANGLVVGAVAEALGIPWVYEVRGQLADTWAATRGEDAKNSERYRLFQAQETAVMDRADAVVTLGESMRAGITARGIDPAKVSLAPNAVGGAYKAEPLAPEAAREQLGLDPACSYVGTVSSLVDYEGIDTLIDAFALLAPRFPRLRLLVVGDGVSRPALQDQARRLGLADRAIFTGRVPRAQAPLYHQAMDVFVVPRRDMEVTRAVTPLKPVEALASARPVVASDLPALAELVHDGVNGRLLPAGDVQELADALSGLLSDRPLRERLGRAGRAAVLDTRTWAANAQGYADIYRALCSTTAGSTTAVSTTTKGSYPA